MLKILQKYGLKTFLVFILGFSTGFVARENEITLPTWRSSLNFVTLDQVKTIQSPGNVIDVCFSPGGNCIGLICKEIDQAKEEILVQAYSFTSKQIAESLAKAKRRGVAVILLIDKSAQMGHGSVIPFLQEKGIEVYYDNVIGLAHNKTMILDKEKLITGSFNFTNAAESRNSENLLVIKDNNLASIYSNNWKKRRKTASVAEEIK